MHVERRLRWLVGALLAALALTVAACGATPSGTGPGGTSPAAKAAAPVSTARATAAATPAPTTSTRTQTQVVLTSGATYYAASDAVAVTVHNTSGQTIYAVANFTDCSIISLERLVGSSWQPVNPCAGGYPHPYVTHITSGTEETIQMSAAMVGSSDNGSGISSWPAGTYRARLTYATSETAALGQVVAAYSATFSVG